MVVPNGPDLAFSGSTWIHWWSPVASANWSIRSWLTSSQSPGSRSVPISCFRFSIMGDDVPYGAATARQGPPARWRAAGPQAAGAHRGRLVAGDAHHGG